MLTILLVAVLGMVGIGAVALERGTWSVNPVLTGSMRPGFAVGGVVISERVPVSSLAVRDVIVFQRPDNPSERVVHRIISLEKGSAGQLLIKTQGDANNAPDPWTLTISGQYVDRVRWSVPLVGYVAIFYENHRGLFLLTSGIVLLAIAAAGVYGARRHSSSQAEKSAESEPPLSLVSGPEPKLDETRPPERDFLRPVEPPGFNVRPEDLVDDGLANGATKTASVPPMGLESDSGASVTPSVAAALLAEADGGSPTNGAVEHLDEVDTPGEGGVVEAGTPAGLAPLLVAVSEAASINGIVELAGPVPTHPPAVPIAAEAPEPVVDLDELGPPVQGRHVRKADTDPVPVPDVSVAPTSDPAVPVEAAWTDWAEWTGFKGFQGPDEFAER